MNLRDYMHFERKGVKQFADEIGITSAHLSRIKNGHCHPSMTLKRLIAMITDNKIKIEDWDDGN